MTPSPGRLQGGRDVEVRERREARAHCLELLRRNPDNAYALYLLGRLEDRAARFNSAERAMRRAVALADDRAAFHHALGEILEHKGAIEAALACYEQALVRDGSLVEALLGRGRLRARQGDIEAADEDLRHAVELRPDDAGALAALGALLQQRGRHTDAIRQYEHAIRADPASAEAHARLGAVHLAQGRLAQAARCFEHALRHAPQMACAEDGLGLVLQEQGRFEQALAHHRRALEADPADPAAHAHLGQALTALGRLDEAAAACARGLELAPADRRCIAGLARIHACRGEHAAGLGLTEPVAALPGADPELVIVHARLLLRVYRVHEAAEHLEPMTASGRHSLSARQQRAVHFALAEAYEMLGHYERAFEQMRIANALKRGAVPAEDLGATVAALIETVDQRTRLPRSSDDGEDVVLIVGMPRSGMGLAEQILIRHPQVVPALHAGVAAKLVGELARITGSRSSYPSLLSELSAGAVNELAVIARGLLGATEGARFLTDADPFNLLHLGLMEAVFPGARVVYCRRDPMDVAISCYAFDYPDRAMGFASSLSTIGSLLHGCQRLERHWRSAGHRRYFELDYEVLVEHPETTVRALLEFLDLDWDDACLRFYERVPYPARRPYVNKPIHRSRVGRHRNYARFLAQLRSQLEPGPV